MLDSKKNQAFCENYDFNKLLQEILQEKKQHIFSGDLASFLDFLNIFKSYKIFHNPGIREVESVESEMIASINIAICEYSQLKNLKGKNFLLIFTDKEAGIHINSLFLSFFYKKIFNISEEVLEDLDNMNDSVSSFLFKKSLYWDYFAQKNLNVNDDIIVFVRQNLYKMEKMHGDKKIFLSTILNRIEYSFLKTGNSFLSNYFRCVLKVIE